MPTREQAGTFYVDIELCCGCQLVPAKRLPRYPRCYSVLEGVGVDNSTILLSLPRCPFPECAVRGVCVDDELQELSGGGKVCQKTAWKVYAGARKYPGKWQKLLPDRKLSPAAQKLPAAEKNVSACCRRECCCLPPKRMFPPAAEENVAVCRRRECCCLLQKRMLLPAAKENSLSGRKSVIRTQKKQPPKKKAV